MLKDARWIYPSRAIKNEGKSLRDESSQQETVLEDGLTSSFNHNLRMTLESLIEDVDELLRRCGR